MHTYNQREDAFYILHFKYLWTGGLTHYLGHIAVHIFHRIQIRLRIQGTWTVTLLQR